MEIYKTFAVEAARSLPNLPDGHPCKKIHGHSFKITITVAGQIDENTGFVMDFSEIDSSFSPIHKLIDHSYLNDLEGLDNPSSENLCKWIWSKLKNSLRDLKRIEIKETESTGCIYRGEKNGKV
ncbi:MAG: 6-carboxytetrahydropterin synthase QueD [Candidatus Neomarinimicrobiota bacterium]